MLITGAEMEEIVYPAIFYYDKEYEDYAVEFCDVCIYTEGDSMQEAYANAQKFLKAYIKCCKEMNLKPKPPSDYQDVELTHPNGKVILVAVEYEDEAAEKTETFTNLNSDILETVEEVDGLENKREDLLKQKKDQSDQGEGDDDFGLPPV